MFDLEQERFRSLAHPLMAFREGKREFFNSQDIEGLKAIQYQLEKRVLSWIDKVVAQIEGKTG